MTLYCAICSKEIPSWPNQYMNLRSKLAVNTPFGPAHEVCWRFSLKRQRALNEGRPNPWQAEDPSKLSGSELGRLRRSEKAVREKIDRAFVNNITGSRKKYYKNPLIGTLSGIDID